MVAVHRLRHVLEYDRIMFLEKGKLVEFDTPQNLLSRQSKFKAVYDLEGLRNERENETG